MPLVAEAIRRGIPLSNDSQIFLEAAPCRVVGITGSAGKTTTTTLVGRMGSAAEPVYRQTWVGGNIGQPLIDRVDEMQAGDLAVMELSSFQLELMTRSPQVAAVLNVTPNHLDRHGSMEAYTAAKARLLDFQEAGDTAVLGRDDPGAWGLAGRVRGSLFSFGLSDLPAGAEGVFVRDGWVWLREDAAEVEVLPLAEIGLRGEHNLLNVLAACAIAAAAGLPTAAMRAGVQGFGGVAHRLEWVRRWGGADWYNDSIATAPERAMAALRSFDQPLVLLAGGRDKDLPWDEFARLAHRKVAHLIAFGEAAELIAAAVEAAAPPDSRLQVTRTGSLHQAVETAARLVQPGQVVLLSPGGTSYDEFKDFEERGVCFGRWVKELP
jgi:UDP-N-acetylmuramoylalanine--D-glutamate ligase